MLVYYIVKASTKEFEYQDTKWSYETKFTYFNGKYKKQTQSGEYPKVAEEVIKQK